MNMMKNKTLDYATSLPPETIDAWANSLFRALGPQAIIGTIDKGTYPFETHPLAALSGDDGTKTTAPGGGWRDLVSSTVANMAVQVNVKVDSDTHVRLQHYQRRADRAAPVMSLSFSHPVRIATDVLPHFASTYVAQRLCGEYAIAVNRVTLDGNGKVSFEVGARNRILSWGANLLLSQAGPVPQAGIEFFQKLVDTLVPPEPKRGAGDASGVAAAHNVAPVPLDKFTMSVQAQSRHRGCLQASGELHQVARQHPFGRALLENPLGRALLPPPSASDPAALAYRLQASVAYEAGDVHFVAQATPSDPEGRAWHACAELTQMNQPKRHLVQAMALAMAPTCPPAAIDCLLQHQPVALAPMLALMHGFAEVDTLQAAPPPYVPPPYAPPPPVRGLPVGLPLSVGLPKTTAQPLVGLLANTQLTGTGALKAGIYSMNSLVPNSRLVVPLDGELQFLMETQPADATYDVRLHRASLRWSGAKPLVWHMGFTHFLFGAAIGRFLDRILHVRINGASIATDGKVKVDGHVYFMGMRVCKVDTITRLAARQGPEQCPTLRADADTAKCLKDILMHPQLAVSNDALWDIWHDMYGLQKRWDWHFKPREGERLSADSGSQGRVELAPLGGVLALTPAGDLELSIACFDKTSCFDLRYTGGDTRIQGLWSGQIKAHLLAYPEGAVVTAETPNETRLEAKLDFRLQEPLPAQVQGQVFWSAAEPNHLSASLDGYVVMPDGTYVRAEAQARGHFVHAAEQATAPDVGGFALDRATWDLRDDLVLPALTVQAGRGGYFTQLSAPQQASLMTLRNERTGALS